MALGVPGRLRPWIFSTFGTTSVVGRQPNAQATFTPGEIPGTRFSFSEAESTSGHMVLSEGTAEKITTDTTGDRSRDRPTSSAGALTTTLLFYIYTYIYSNNIPPIMFINGIYETQNLLLL